MGGRKGAKEQTGKGEMKGEDEEGGKIVGVWKTGRSRGGMEEEGERDDRRDDSVHRQNDMQTDITHSVRGLLEEQDLLCL